MPDLFLLKQMHSEAHPMRIHNCCVLQYRLMKGWETMRKPAALLSVLLVMASFNVASPGGGIPRQSFEFANGRWFDGYTFRNRVFYSVDGILTSKRPKRVDSLIDLK